MRNLLILFTILPFLSCSSADVTNESPFLQTRVIEYLTIPNDTVNIKDLNFVRNISQWFLNDSMYSGYAATSFPDGGIKKVKGINKGYAEGRSTEYYSGNMIKSEAYYHQGKLHGSKKIWSNDSAHILLAELSFYNGKADGLQKKWYNTGELFVELNMKNGKEQGLQRAYRRNGNLYANYEAINGRIFGLKRAALCVELEDEKIKTKK